MVVETILGNVEEIESKKASVNVAFEWFELEKKRIAKTAEDGTEFGICVGEMLKEGDILAETEEKVYICKVVPTRLIKVSVATMQEMGRLCFELGNRHLSLKIETDSVSVPYDHPTFEYLRKLGFDANDITDAFTSFTECKAHGSSNHSHSHDHAHTHDHVH